MSGYFKTPEVFEAICPVATVPFAKKRNEPVAAIADGSTDAQINKECLPDLVKESFFMNMQITSPEMVFPQYG